MIESSANFGCSIFKHPFPGTPVSKFVAVFSGDVQNYESLDRTVKWVKCRCCVMLIHYS